MNNTALLAIIIKKVQASPLSVGISQNSGIKKNRPYVFLLMQPFLLGTYTFKVIGLGLSNLLGALLLLNRSRQKICLPFRT